LIHFRSLFEKGKSDSENKRNISKWGRARIYEWDLFEMAVLKAEIKAMKPMKKSENEV